MKRRDFLVKAAPGLSSGLLESVDFTVTPLFTSIAPPNAQAGDEPSTWHMLSLPGNLEEENDWDVCHSLVEQVPGVEFAEPDLEQKWLTSSDTELGMALSQSCEAVNPQDLRFPGVPDNPFWFRDAGHAQFDDAIAEIGGPQVVSPVRIAHLDTGYDPEHRALPRRLRRDLARNFLEDGRPDDASEQAVGLLNSLGHGMGTLGILAGEGQPGGALLGGAPFAEIVPLRVANSLTRFKTSAIARAFDYVHALNKSKTDRIDIITLSLGGVASQAWADAINALYEQGVFIVTAAGNNYGNFPTRSIVYPARFNRVVAACGVMADGSPYAALDVSSMAGNYGPEEKMETAIAAPTPNVPWVRHGCETTVDFNGRGTSVAAPQVAAAAALWLHKNYAAIDAYPQAWMRAEAIRTALFASARKNAATKRWIGKGELRAKAALAEPPAAVSSLRETVADTASSTFLRILGGSGPESMAGPEMLELEALQLSQGAAIEHLVPADLAKALPDERQRLADALRAHPSTSRALRAALGDRDPVGETPLPVIDTIEKLWLTHATTPRVPVPLYRPLRVYAYDPSVGASLATIDINEAILKVRWETNLQPGPVGEYIEVVDVDPASQCCYAPIDLNHPHILTQSGLTPSESSPQFHQQMAYAVAMKTIEYFERALGRVALWANHTNAGELGRVSTQFVRRLRIYPHALRTQNAYYSPDRVALLLGYFTNSASDSGSTLPGSVVFTAVSHDIVAHETTHALLHGLNRRSIEPTNPDVYAFHEAFADIVALFQHFTLPEALRYQIAKTKGDLERENLLGQIAVQFGQTTNRFGALRDYIGRNVELDKVGKQNGNKAGDGEKERKWVRHAANRTDYETTSEPHERGAILVTAIFDAFLQIYRRRKADLVRLATAGSGVLPEGEISIDLVNRLSREASKVAGQVLNMCIRALDYCPPDLTFGEYLRALITADTDLVPEDKYGYRTAIVSAFRERGIYPRDVKHPSPASLLWEPPPLPIGNLITILREMSLTWDLNSDREEVFSSSRHDAIAFWRWLNDRHQVSDQEIDNLGLSRIARSESRVIDGVEGELRPIEVHAIRPARRIGPEGNILFDIIVEISQTFRTTDEMPGLRIRAGCTLIIDYSTFRLRYMLRKKLRPRDRLDEFLQRDQHIGLRDNYFGYYAARYEPFALMHRVHG